MPVVSSDHNLLFGLLALQTDFVTQSQLIEAMNAWMLEKATPLGELLCQRGVMDADDRAAVERLVTRHAKRHGGEQAGLAAVRVGDDVRASLASLGDADVQASVGFVTKMPEEDVSGARLPTGQPPLSARYSRLRPHARGGLGEVSVARDEELGREVALKEIQARFADHPDSRARFVREAEITGQLEHPGVVPVYGLGIHADGRPYYAMRFIRGEPMHEAIARFHKADEGKRDPGERSLALRELLNRFVAVCDAVAYAHSRSVIHRDLKPANVMLGDYGETLVVDWGLARVVTQDDPDATTAGVPVALSGSGTATQLGQAVGTPAFMSPEQARGEHDKTGPASDVFSLGATLYDVLTGKPPHAGANGAEALELARKGEIVPARKRKANVPRALEAVCARALAAVPEQRYDGAKALAADVRRWLADESASAYREPVVDRVRRWGRRHRSVVSAGVMLLVVGVVVLSVGLWAVNREKTKTAKALELEEIARGEAEANLKLAEENLKLARTAIDECYNVADKDPLFQQPRMEKAKKLLFEKTLPFYKRFRAQRPDDRRIQGEEAEQWFRVARVEQILGNTKGAREAYVTALGMFAALVGAHPDVPGYQNALANTHNNLGILLNALGEREPARKEFQEARTIRTALAKAHPNVPEYQKALADTHNNLGILLNALGEREPARKEYQEARTIYSALVKAHPKVIDYREGLARACINRGDLSLSANAPRDALADFDQGIAATDQLLKIAPKNPNALLLLRFGLPLRAAALDRLRRGKDADADWDRLLALTPAAERGAVRLQRAESRASAGDYLRAAAYVVEQSDNDTLSGGRLYDLARIQSLNAHHAARDAARPLPERERRAEAYAKDAIVLLKRAKDVKLVAHAAKDDDLAPLRQRDDFRAFIAALKHK